MGLRFPFTKFLYIIYIVGTDKNPPNWMKEVIKNFYKNNIFQFFLEIEKSLDCQYSSSLAYNGDEVNKQMGKEGDEV